MIKRKRQYDNTLAVVYPGMIMSGVWVDDYSSLDHARARQSAERKRKDLLKKAEVEQKLGAPIRKQMEALSKKISKGFPDDADGAIAEEAAKIAFEKKADAYEVHRKEAARYRGEATRQTSKVINDKLKHEARLISEWAAAAIQELTEIKAEADGILKWKADELKGKLRKGISKVEPAQSVADLINSKKAKKLKSTEERHAFLVHHGVVNGNGHLLGSSGFVSYGYGDAILEWIKHGKSSGLIEIVKSEEMAADPKFGEAILDPADL